MNNCFPDLLIIQLRTILFWVLR